jgi:hypothetical protein
VSGDWVAQSTWWEWVDRGLETAPLARAFEIEDPGLDAGSPLEELATWAGTEARVGGDLDAPWDLAASLDEHTIYRWAGRHDEPAVVIGSMVMLALVARRLRATQIQAAYADDWDICQDGGVARLAVNRFLWQWHQRVMSGASIGEAARGRRDPVL